MKKLFIILSVFFLSCEEGQPTQYLEYDFIIKDKVELNDKFFLKSTQDSVLSCSAKQFVVWDIGDTIPMVMVQNGFWKGMHLLDTKSE